MRRSPFLSLSGAHPLSEPLPIGGRQLPDSLACRPSLCSILHILACNKKGVNRPHCAVRILKHGNGVADSLPGGSGNLNVQPGRQWSSNLSRRRVKSPPFGGQKPDMTDASISIAA